jgi:hypothetical protein
MPASLTTRAHFSISAGISWPGRLLISAISAGSVSAPTDQAHRREILHRVIGQRPVDAGTDGERGHRREQQHVAVRRRLGDRRGGDHGAGAGAIFDDERLLELVLQLLRQ